MSLYGTNNVVERCRFENQNHSGVVVTIWGDFGGAPNNHIVRDNHVVDMPRDPQGGNGWETSRIGTSEFSGLSSATTIERNLFERCNGEMEIISVKTGDNVLRGNTFRESEGTLTLRHGERAHVSENFFFGEGNRRTGGSASSDPATASGTTTSIGSATATGRWSPSRCSVTR